MSKYKTRADRLKEIKDKLEEAYGELEELSTEIERIVGQVIQDYLRRPEVKQEIKNLILKDVLAWKNKAWAGFVLELRRVGYWGDAEKQRKYFEGYFDSYFEDTDDRPLEWYFAHCCDSIEFGGLELGRGWTEWTNEDRKKAMKEHGRILGEKE